MFPGAVGKNMADLCMLYPDDDQEDHLWRDEIFTMIVGVCYFTYNP